MHGYLSLDIICSLKRTVFLELLGNCSLLGTDNVRGQISMHIFAQQWRPLFIKFSNYQNSMGHSSQFSLRSVRYLEQIGTDNFRRVYFCAKWRLMFLHSYGRVSQGRFSTTLTSRMRLVKIDIASQYRLQYRFFSFRLDDFEKPLLQLRLAPSRVN